MEQTGFFSRTDPNSLEWMHKLFMPDENENLVWFVEHESTNRWVTEDSDHVCGDNYDYSKTNPSGKFIIHNDQKMYCKYDKVQTTNNPLKAKQFKTQMQALTYCVKNKLGSNYTQTEHEFVPSDGKEKN